VFQAQGVSGTSLADIAEAAGTTRGAIYWHFKDKADLYNAMIERVSLPLEHSFREAAAGASGDPLQLLRGAVQFALRRITDDPQTRRVFEVATQKVEYIESLSAVRQRHLAVRAENIEALKAVLKQAARHRDVRLALPAEAAAHGLHSLADGLIQNWLLDPSAFDLVACGRKTVDAYLRGVGLE
jgi:TetR/AcrR family transcriptional regulator, acrAB operon repressor